MAIQLGSAYGTIELDASGVRKGVEGARDVLSGLGDTVRNVFEHAMGNLVSQGIQNLIGGIIRIGQESGELASNFESQMAVMATAVDPAVASLQDLHTAALAVGGDTELIGIDASQAAEAMTGMFKAGLSVNDVFGDMQGYLAGNVSLTGALRASVDLQAASSLNLAQASDLVVVAMSTYGLSAADATRITDNFVQAADASVAEVEDLGEAIKTIGPTAAAMGISLEDTNNALAILSTRGIKGAEAGTALKSMMTNLQRPTDAVVETLDKLNVSLYDSEGQFVGLPSVISQFEKGLAGLTQEERNLAIQTVAGTYGMTAMNTLLAEGSQGWQDMADAIAGSSTAAEIAAARTDTLRGAQEQWQGTLETLKIQIGEAFLPLRRTATEAMTAFASEHGPQVIAIAQQIAGVFRDLGQAFAEGGISGVLREFLPADLAEQIIGLLDKFRDAFGGVGDAASQLKSPLDWIKANALPALVNVLAFVNEHWDAFKAALLVVAGVLAGSALVSGVTTVAVTIAALANPITLIVGALALLAAAWAEDWGGIRTALTAFWEGTARPALEQLWAWLSVNIPAAIQTVSAWWRDTFIPAIQGAFAWLQSAWATLTGLPAQIAAVWEALKTAVGQKIEETRANVVERFNALRDGVVGVWQSIWEFATLVWEGIKMAIVVAVGLLLAIITGDWTSAGQIITTIWNNLVTAATTIWQSLLTLISTIVTNIREWLTQTWDNIKAMATAKWEAIKASVIEKFTALKTSAVNQGEELKSTLPAIWEGIKATASEKFEALKAAVQEKIAEAKNTVTTKVEEIRSFIQGFSLRDAGVNLIRGFIDGILSMVGEVTGAISNLVNGAIQAAKDALGIHSPSAVFGWIAEMSAAGYIKQLSAMQGAMERVTASVMGDNALAGMQAAGRVAYDQRRYEQRAVNVYGGMHVQTTVGPRSVLEDLAALA